MRGAALEDHGRGRPLVLVHGLATTRVVWRRVLPHLAARRRVVTLDVPGFGASPPAGPGFVLDDVAAVIGRALAAHGVPTPFDLVGHSMGGAVAIALATQQPATVRRLVLVAPAGLRPMAMPAARAFGAFAAAAIPLRRRAAPLAGASLGRLLLMTPGTVDPAALDPADVRALLAASCGATRISEALATVASADLRPQLRALPHPVGIVWGDRDRVIPPGGIDTVRSLRPGAPVATIAGTGHIPMIERPAAFAHALTEVLAESSRTGNTGR